MEALSLFGSLFGCSAAEAPHVERSLQRLVGLRTEDVESGLPKYGYIVTWINPVRVVGNASKLFHLALRYE
jgi:hypothetical protein